MNESSKPMWTESALRVRYSETDQMGIVYHANYFPWFEIGRTDFCRMLGFTYRDMEMKHGLFITVAEARCRYKVSARYDDDLVVRTRLRAARKRVLIFGYEIFRQPEGALLAEGETTHVITNRQGRPTSLPEDFGRLFGGACA